MSTPPSAVGWRDDELFSYITRAPAPITLLGDSGHDAMRHDSRGRISVAFEIATSRPFV